MYIAASTPSLLGESTDSLIWTYGGNLALVTKCSLWRRGSGGEEGVREHHMATGEPLNLQGGAY